jgi:SNF2 family DNA or RNA helicase
MSNKKFEISYIEEQQKVVLISDDPRIFTHPFFKVTLARFSAKQLDNECHFFTKKENLPEVYRQLKNISIKIGWDVQESEGSSQLIADARRKEELFEEFSQKCLDIWSGHVIPKELEDFEKTISSGINRTLRPLQFLSALHLAFSQNACNFSVPGAGKTTIVYSAYSYLKNLPPDNPKHVDRIFVIGPLASFYAWRKEFKDCFGAEPKYARIVAGMNKRDLDDIFFERSSRNQNIDFYHASFQTVCNLESQIISLLNNPARKTMLVVDEAHNIKRFDGVWSSSCIRLSEHATSRVILTGTPAPNGYEDLFNLFKFLYPERNLIGFPRANLVSMSAGDMPSEPMRARIKPFFTRITKSHLELPPFFETIMKIEMGPKEKNIYKGLEDLLMPSLGNLNKGGLKPFQKASLIRLRQAASNPKMLLMPLLMNFIDDDGMILGDGDDIELAEGLIEEVKSFNQFVDNSKLNSLIKLCKEKVANNEKILIWSYFISSIDLIENSLKETLGIPVMRITGSTPSEGDSKDYDENLFTREKIITAFIEDDDCKILIANPQALGESVSLHYSCHNAIYYDRDFNCGKFVQSKDRIHRFGLPSHIDTNYYYLTYVDSVDEDIANTLTIKETRMNSLMERDEIPLFKGIDDDEGQANDIKVVLRSYASRKLL